MKRTALLCALLAGCAHTHSEVNVGTRVPHAGVQVHIEGGRGLAALLGLSILAAGIYETDFAPPLAPDRRVSEQDCTRPLDYSLGNIRCK